MTIKRISEKEIRQSILGQDIEVAPSFMPKILRAAWAWKFSRQMAKKFNRELTKDRFKEFLKALAKKFV